MEKRGMPFTGFSADERKAIKYVISDVDDTITTDGALLPEALEAMYCLRDAGKPLILVTGGSSGWADAYIRQWPVDVVVAESGAVLLTREKNGGIRYTVNPLIEGDPRIMERRRAFMEENRRYAFSSDQYARMFDIAYEKSAMGEGDEERLLERVGASGATALVSSIHVNVLFAPLSKAVGVRTFYPMIREAVGTDDGLQTFLSRSVSLGDSTNDEALFEMTGCSVGNRRVSDCRDDFSILPTWITSLYGGKSFHEVSMNLIDENYSI